MTNISHSALVLENSVVVTVDGTPRSVNDSHVAYAQIREAVRTKDWDSIPTLLDTKAAVKTYVNAMPSGKVVVDEEAGRLVVRFDNEVINNSVTSRIVAMMREDFDATPMIMFLENLMENPDYRAANDLLDWLEAGNMPITEDGYILGYKNVNKDFTDMRTGTMDNSPGKVVEMRRNACNPNPDETCSSGLHFCAQSYLGSYGGDNGKTVIVKIHPRDVVAFPRDYNLAKGRCCRYEVVGEHTKGVANTAFKSEVVDQEWKGNVSTETIDSTRESILDEIGRGSVVSIEEAMTYFDCTRSALRRRCVRGHSARWAGHNKVELLS